VRSDKLDGQEKIDQDYNSLNIAAEHRTEIEIKKLRENINTLKEKAEKIGEALTNPPTTAEGE
jgi:archaellum component FlaC